MKKTEVLGYSEALDFIGSVSWKGSVPGLERIAALCRLLGHPEREVKFVHVAGTNGKGSVSAMISSMLSASGYRTGTFTSPHLVDYTERISVDGEDISREDFARAAATVKDAARDMEDAPTEFEILTAMALVHFARVGCDAAVLECGMGGRLDATNIIPSPLVSVITNIALDHTAILGDTEVKIAREKAGIIKTSPVVLGASSPQVKECIFEVCERAGVTLYDPHDTKIEFLHLTSEGLCFRYRGIQMTLPLVGEYQRTNLATALTALEVLESSGLRIDSSSLKHGIECVRWRGRFEILSSSPVVIFDGAHNPDGAKLTADTFESLYPGRRAVLLTGVMADKDHRGIASELSRVASRVITVSPDNSRALDAAEYALDYRALWLDAEPYSDVSAAVGHALSLASESGAHVLCSGSLYMYSDILRAVRGNIS